MYITSLMDVHIIWKILIAPQNIRRRNFMCLLLLLLFAFPWTEFLFYIYLEDFIYDNKRAMLFSLFPSSIISPFELSWVFYSRIERNDDVFGGWDVYKLFRWLIHDKMTIIFYLRYFLIFDSITLRNEWILILSSFPISW